MISLAAWMTVSMSALSKLSTTKRPRCSAGTSGAVLGAGGSVGSASTCGGGSAVSGLGPTEADGTGGSDSCDGGGGGGTVTAADGGAGRRAGRPGVAHPARSVMRSEEHTSELQSPCNLVCRLLLEKKKKDTSARRNSP